jgi:cytochrome c-type biogenesis protein CcmH
MKKQKSLLFCEQKRSKKNFDSLVGAPPASHTPVIKFFLLLFCSQKRRLFFLLVFLPLVSHAQTVTRDGVTLTQAQETRAESLGDQLRCLVCQNESIEASGATLAKQLRVIIRQQVIQGVPDRGILNFMVQRYGIFVLLKPPFEPLTYLLYATPFLGLVLGALLFWLGRSGTATPPPPLTPAEQARLQELRRH